MYYLNTDSAAVCALEGNTTHNPRITHHNDRVRCVLSDMICPVQKMRQTLTAIRVAAGKDVWTLAGGVVEGVRADWQSSDNASAFVGAMAGAAIFCLLQLLPKNETSQPFRSRQFRCSLVRLSR